MYEKSNHNSEDGLVSAGTTYTGRLIIRRRLKPRLNGVYL